MLWKSVIHPDDLPLADQSHQQKLMLGHSTVNEYRIILPNEDIRWVLTRAIPRLDEEGQLLNITGIVIDITERKTLELQIRSLAYQDSLTELPNRKHFEEILENEIRLAELSGTKMALLTLHVHRYKQINDTLGDQIADQSIKILAERLSKHVPKGNVVARIREDDFAILLKDKETVEEVLDIANHLIRTVTDMLKVETFEFHLFANIGISLFPQDCSDRQTIRFVQSNRAK